GGGVPGVAEAAARTAAAAREEDPAAAVLREHDPVADRGRARHLADARVPAPGQDPGPAPRGPNRGRLIRGAYPGGDSVPPGVIQFPEAGRGEQARETGGREE